MTDYIPKLGDPFTTLDFDLIMSAVQKRAEKFPDEPATLTMALVMLNIGNRFTQVVCSNGEWRGIRTEVDTGEGDILCPNGHELLEESGIQLGWIST